MSGTVQIDAIDSVSGNPGPLKKVGDALEVTDALSLSGNAALTLAISSTGVDVNSLAAGKYAVWTTTDCFIKVHATNASDVTAATGFPVYASATPLTIIVPDTYALGAITTAAAGTLSYHKVG